MVKSDLPRILILDDDKDILQALEFMFRNEYSVHTFTSSAEALKWLTAEGGVAVVLVDLHLKGESGLDLLLEVKNQFPSSVRVVMTGNLDVQVLTRLVNEVQIHRVILKPWNDPLIHIHLAECVSFHKNLIEKESLAKMSITDPVTMLYNHRYFQEQLRRGVEHAKRHNRPISLMICDLDKFKEYNDNQGHPEGDRLLYSIGQELQNTFRSSDIVCRYGGDEFIIILPETDLDDAFEVAERIRIKISKGHSTISVGVAGYPKSGGDAESILKAADFALYDAKKLGRNRTVKR